MELGVWRFGGGCSVEGFETALCGATHSLHTVTVSNESSVFTC